MESNRANPLVSVCVPTYNGERYLAETLDSAARQTYPNMEIVVSDDQSTDRTPAIIEDFRKRSLFPFAFHVHQRSGLAANWNFCIQQSHGRYVKIMGQDDLLEPDAVAALVERALQDPRIGMAFSPRRVLVSPPDSIRDPNVHRLASAIRDIHLGWTSLKPIQCGADLLRDPAIFHGCPNKVGEPVTVLMRRDLFDQLGGFDLEMKHLLDLDMWLRLMMVSHVGFVDRPLCCFRVHADQATVGNRRDGTAAREQIQLYWKFLAGGGIKRLCPTVQEEVFWDLWTSEHGRPYRHSWPLTYYRVSRKVRRLLGRPH